MAPNIELNLKTLTQLLEIIQPEILVDLKDAIILSLDDPKAMRSIVNQKCEYREQTRCYSCGNEAGCLILNGIAHLDLGETETAIKKLENANQHFRNEGELWNYIIGLALMGHAYKKSGKEHRASHEYEKAYDLIKNNYLRIHANEYIEKALSLEKALKAKLEEMNSHSLNKQAAKPAQSRLAFPWMPAYTGLQAGPNGPIWCDSLPEDKGSFVDGIILEDKQHDIYSLKQGDFLITLTSAKKYGWAKVSGDSMNASKPIPIMKNDFVLFYDSKVADNHAVIIAACPDRTGSGYQYVVKRYAQNIQHLVSETEPPDRYAPMPITSDTIIIGVVIAVAKSKNTMHD